MARDATVRARVDTHLKKNVEEILSQIGLSTSQAITLFFKRIEQEKGIPFELKISNEQMLETMKEENESADDIDTIRH